MTKRNPDPDGVHLYSCAEVCAEYAAGRVDVSDIRQAWMEYYAETGEAFAGNGRASIQPSYLWAALEAVGAELLREQTDCHVTPVAKAPRALSWYVRATFPKAPTGKRLTLPPWSGLRVRGIYACQEDGCWLVVLDLIGSAKAIT